MTQRLQLLFKVYPPNSCIAEKNKAITGMKELRGVKTKRIDFSARVAAAVGVNTDQLGFGQNVAVYFLLHFFPIHIRGLRR